jgi:hypothetical protein
MEAESPVGRQSLLPPPSDSIGYVIDDTFLVTDLGLMLWDKGPLKRSFDRESKLSNY